ncbi:MAG: hypothetical protein ACOYU7_01585 [Bacillota bacterium]
METAREGSKGPGYPSTVQAPFEIAANRSFFSYPQQAFAEKPGDVGKSPGRYLLEQVPTFKGIADAVAPLNPETPVSSRILSPLGLKPLWLDTKKVAEGRERNYYNLLQAVRRQAEEQGIEVPTVREIEKIGYVSERLKRRRKRL